MKEHKISFPAFNTEVYALPGTSMFECVTRAGILIRTPCAGAGKCGKCAIRVLEGDLPPSKECLLHFSEEQLASGYRLACRTSVNSDLIIDIPASTLFESGVIALSDDNGMDGDARASGAVPMAVTTELQLSKPSLENPISDIDNLKLALGSDGVRIDLSVLRRLPEILRDNNFNVVVPCTRDRVISVAPPKFDGKSANLALAVDLGTTTIAMSLLDPDTGRQIATAGCLNPQVKFGDDVLNRICAQTESDDIR